MNFIIVWHETEFACIDAQQKQASLKHLGLKGVCWKNPPKILALYHGQIFPLKLEHLWLTARILQLGNFSLFDKKSISSFKWRIHLLSTGWPSGGFQTTFDQKRRTDIMWEKIFFVFWWRSNYVAFHMSCLIPLIQIHQC